MSDKDIAAAIGSSPDFVRKIRTEAIREGLLIRNPNGSYRKGQEKPTADPSTSSHVLWVRGQRDDALSALRQVHSMLGHEPTEKIREVVENALNQAGVKTQGDKT